MILEILIPQYKEDESVLKNLLDSIEVQQSVDLKNDVGVVIVNDGSDIILSESFLDKYTFPIKYIKREHGGVSRARNACLDEATADYVMFCDADDMFLNACGLYIIMREIKNGGFDSMFSVFVEETKHPKTGEVLYINREMDSTFVHGKVHRRRYLIDKGIRWNDSLTIHEDSYFNCLCQNLSKDVKYCNTPFYLWKWRNESVCRHDPKYILKTYNNMLESSTALVNEFLKRNRKDKAEFYATGMIMDSYYTMNKEEWLNQDNIEYRNSTEKRFAKYYVKFRSLFENIDETIKNQIIVGIRNRMFQEGMMMEAITFNMWIEHILDLYQQEVNGK